MKSKFLFIITSIILFSCKEIDNPVPQVVESYDVIVLNEGNFRSGNASVSLYSNTGKVLDKVFQRNNNGRPLCDIAQSMIEKNGKAYIVINNSNKIEVLDIKTFQSVGSITGLNSPRYILPVGGDKAYVSDLYQDEIHVVDLESLAVLKTIETKGWTEEMVLVNDKAFVCQVDSDQVWVFDVNEDTLMQKINTNVSPLSICKDINNQVWVSCSGGFNLGFPAVIQINSNSLQVEKKLEIKDVNKSISNLKINSDQDELYYLSEELYKFSISDTSLPSAPFISSQNRNFYDFGIEPVNGGVYIADAIDYQQSGVIYQYNTIGQEIGNFRVGLIPGYIHF